MEGLKPKYRFKLKSAIPGAGFRRQLDFAKQAGIASPRLSRIIGGYEYPSADLAERMANALGVTMQEFKSILDD